MSLVDAHCHLDHLDDPAAALERAREAGVERVLAVAEDADAMRTLLDLRAAHPDRVLCGLGVHPANLLYLDEDERAEARAFLVEHAAEADAIGEIGLDRKHATTDEERALQADWLELQTELAAEHGLPINLHSRWAERRTMEAAVAYVERTGNGALLHWFNQSTRLVGTATEAGVHVSAGPTILHGEQALEVACAVPDDLLLLETDAPVPAGGEPTEPSWVARLVEPLAEARGTTPERLVERTGENFERYLGS